VDAGNAIFNHFLYTGYDRAQPVSACAAVLRAALSVDKAAATLALATLRWRGQDAGLGTAAG